MGKGAYIIAFVVSLALSFALIIAHPFAARAMDTVFLPEQAELFNSALSQIGLTPGDVRFNNADLNMWGGDKYRLSVHRFLFDNPWKTSAYTRALSNGLLKQTGNLPALITSAHGKLDCSIRLGLTGDPLEATKKKIEELGDKALAQALSEIGGKPADWYMSSEYKKAPPLARKAAALVLFTVPDALRYRDLGLTQPILKLGLDPEQVYREVLDYSVTTFAEEEAAGVEGTDDLSQVLLIESLLDNVDWNLMNTGSTLLALALNDAKAMLTAEGIEIPQVRFSYRMATPLGIVAISGTETDYYTAAPNLLTLDLGGDDTYNGCATNFSYAEPVSLALDLAGDDKYISGEPEKPAFGAGIFGTALLMDCAGNDIYQMGYAGEGCGIFGTGAVQDLEGNDFYDSYGFAQGSGTFGTGLLIDAGGRDTYRTYKCAQGYGFTRGCGMLIDGGDGNDYYYANLVDHFNGGLYGATHHVHFVQGSAFGRRADFTEGHSWAGGFGIICDGGGDDLYEADCYGQGNAYWYSVGMCVDKGGNDVYHAGQYSQASAPHFAAGILQDEAGDDKYVISIRQSMGHGRDWSLAWFEDAAGNDWYQGARTTMGVSHVNAISVFWDRHGDDTYLSKGPTLGMNEPEPGGSLRDFLLMLGMFVEGGGHDRYYLLPGDESYEGSSTFTGNFTEADLSKLTPLGFAGDGKTWVRSAPTPESPGNYGIGVDAE